MLLPGVNAATPPYTFLWVAYGNGNITLPYGIAVNSSGYVYVADTYNDRIQILSSGGAYVTEWGTSGSGAGQFYRPHDISINNSGYMYEADYGNSRIQIFTPDGKYLTKWGSYGNGTGQFKNPSAIAVNSSGYVYVADTFNDRIQVFTPGGGYVTKWGAYGTLDGYFKNTSGIAVNSSGFVFVADTNNHRIQVFTPGGAFVKKWGSGPIDYNGDFTAPSGIAVDNSDFVYVADTGNCRVQMFTPGGGYLTQWGTYGSGDGMFISPFGIAVDRSGFVYVADTWNNRIQKFAAPSPIASFTASPTSGSAPLLVQFTDSSVNLPAGWAWYFGDETYTAPWTMMTASSGWSARTGHSSVAMPDGSVVLMGGGNKNDTWQSTNNGATWTRVNPSSGWTGRSGHNSVVMPDGSVVLMGGGNKNDTWQSTDKGATWTRVNASSGWTGRNGHSSVATPDGSIVLMGGYDGGDKNDTWQSTDTGATWTRMNASSGWTGRDGHTSVAMPDGSIILMGGYDGSFKNDTWRSTDKGATWTRVNASSGWTGRDGPGSVVMPDSSIVLMGGGGYKNDTWRSTDKGATWRVVNTSSGWTGRYGHSSVVMPDSSIILMGGSSDRGDRNDTWRFMPAGSSAQNPSHTYTKPGNYTVALQVYNTGGYNSTRKVGYTNVTNMVSGSKIGVFRNSTHLFYLDYNGNGAWNGAAVDRQYTFGITGDIPVTGDWNNDSKSEIGVFRNSTHLFYLDYNGNGVWNGASVDRQYNFGITGDIPITGDWDNNGISEIGIFRPSTHLFYLDYNGNGVWNGASVDRQYNFGITGDIPITGDWDNNGISEIGIFRPSTHLFYLDYNGNGVWNGAVVDRTHNFGITGDIPVAGDWNNDGISEIGVFRNSTHLFYLDYNGNSAWNGAGIDRTYNFGITGDIPISGKW